MEDLFPLLIFIVFIIINVLKAKSDTAKKRSRPPAQPKGPEPKRQPSSLEEFFEEMARKFEPEPEPARPPEWPEEVERPDYAKEMHDFEAARTELVEKVAPPPPKPQPKVVAPITPIAIGREEVPQPRATAKTQALRLPVQGAVFAGLGGMRVSTPPLLRSTTGQIDFDLKSRKKLKQAIIAGLVFGQPRAYDTSFHNTIAK